MGNSALQRIPVKVRGALYITWGVVILALTMWAGWFEAVQEPTPELVVRLTYIWGIFGAAFAFTAAGNSDTKPEPEEIMDLTDEVDPDTIG